MGQIGKQVTLPLRRAFQIAAQGIRIRLGRSLVTVSGVVLGIAFLMSNITAQIIKGSIAREREERLAVNLMVTMLQGEIGNIADKRVSVAAFGRLSAVEKAFLARLQQAAPKELKGHGAREAGIAPAALSGIGHQADILLVLGDTQTNAVSLADLTDGMVQKVVLDSLVRREFAGVSAPANFRRELFFGKETEAQISRLQQEARQSRFRTLWIAAVSILVTVIGIANALLMSVTERFKEIGTMKCLGALSGFIRRLFLIESAMIGFAGSVIGTVSGGIIPILAFGFSFQFRVMLGALPWDVLLSIGAFCIVAGTLMAMLAAVYPARFASRMVPASALRSNI